MGNGQEIYYDVFGNFQYGYMVAHFGVDEAIALEASTTGLEAGDPDPTDNKSVSLGYRFAEQYPGAFTADQFYAYLTSPSSTVTLTAAGKMQKRGAK